MAADTSPIFVRPACVPDELPLIRTLFREYADSLGFGLGFQGFEDELAGLPGDYAPPRGAILLGGRAGPPEDVLAVVALRPLAPEVCEMKRMYVRPAARGLGLGRALGVAILDAGRS